MLLPSALYRGLVGQFFGSFPLYGIFVQLSGNPCNLSHSSGVSFRTLLIGITTSTTLVSPTPPVVIALEVSTSLM